MFRRTNAIIRELIWSLQATYMSVCITRRIYKIKVDKINVSQYIKRWIIAYALHILNNTYEYGPPGNTLRMLKPCQKGNFMNLWKTFYIQQLHYLRLLFDEQQQHELNPLYTLGRIPQQSTASNSS
jgi:hypothetical protein